MLNSLHAQNFIYQNIDAFVTKFKTQILFPIFFDYKKVTTMPHIYNIYMYILVTKANIYIYGIVVT